MWSLLNYFRSSSETESIKEVNEVENKGLYLESRWGFSEGTRKYKWQLTTVSMVSRKDLAPGERGRMVFL